MLYRHGGLMRLRSTEYTLSSTTIVTLAPLSGWRSLNVGVKITLFKGKHYHIDDAIMQPKPATHPRPVIYAGGESEAAKQMISRLCDAYVMHGDEPARVKQKIADMSERR